MPEAYIYFFDIPFRISITRTSKYGYAFRLIENFIRFLKNKEAEMICRNEQVAVPGTYCTRTFSVHTGLQ